MKKTKTIRFSDSVIEDIESRAPGKFSEFVNQAVSSKLKEYTWVPNVNVHKNTSLSPQEFLRKVQNVEYLRTSNSLEFSFYPTSKDDVDRYKALFDYVNGSYNALNLNIVTFNVLVPTRLLNFMLTSDWKDMERVMIAFCAFLMAKNDEDRNLVERQFHAPFLKRAIPIYEEIKPISDQIEKKREKDGWSGIFSLGQEYIKLMKKHGIDSMVLPYVQPILDPIRWFFRDELFTNSDNVKTLRIRDAYFRNVYDIDDWQRIIENDDLATDNLHRAESLSEPWEKWFSDFQWFHSIHNYD